MEILLLLGGIAIGVLIGWVISFYKYKSESTDNDTALGVYHERIKDLSNELENQREELKRERDKVMTLSNRLTGNQAEYRHMEKRLSEQRQEIDHIQKKFSDEFKTSPTRFLRKNQKNLPIKIK